MREFGGNLDATQRERAASDAIAKVSGKTVPRDTVRRPSSDYRAAPWDLVISSGTSVYLPSPRSVPLGCVITVAAVSSCTVRVDDGVSTVRGVSSITMGANATLPFHNTGSSWV